VRGEGRGKARSQKPEEKAKLEIESLKPEEKDNGKTTKSRRSLMNDGRTRAARTTDFAFDLSSGF